MYVTRNFEAHICQIIAGGVVRTIVASDTDLPWNLRRFRDRWVQEEASRSTSLLLDYWCCRGNLVGNLAALALSTYVANGTRQ